MRRTASVAAAVVAALLLAACAGAAGAGDEPAADDVAGDVVVFAAASLTEAFAAIAEQVEADHPGLEVILNLAGSQQLAGQVVAGAPADVLASANPDQMAVVADAGLVAGVPEPLATNALAVVVEPGNPLAVDGLDDLARPDLTVVLAAPDVPAGRYAAEALAGAGVTVSPASLEPDVRAALSKVALGEADAAITYRSDAVAADGDVEAVAVPDAVNVPARYPIAVLAEAPNPEGAAAFVAAATSAEGRAVLAVHGFSPP